MSNSLLNAIRRKAFSYVYLQAIGITLISILFFICGKNNTAFSLFVGGMICVIPNLCFAHKLFLHTGAQNVHRIMKAFYFGGLFKFLLTLVLFYITFVFFKTSKIPLFMGFIITQTLFWFAAISGSR